MTDSTLPPPPPAAPGWLPPPPPPTPEPRRRGGLLAAGIAVVLLMVAVAVAVAMRSFDSGPDHPDEWDERVIDLVAFVEAARGLRFEHPVHVDFLTADEYRDEVTSDETELDDEDRTDLARLAGALRALGLASGELDLFEAFNQLADSSTLAFYRPATERVLVRGTDLTVGVRVTLVHELTHALQDQHFDLGVLDDEDVEPGEATAFRALVEGDAGRIEQAYVASELTTAEQAEYEEEYAGEIERSDEGTAGVPSFISASFAAPYALGQPFVLMLANDGGNRAVDEAFDDPPDTEDDLFDPASYLAGEIDEELDLGLDDDIEPFDDGVFGSPSWYLMLAERIDPKQAFAAALGWGGDAFAFYEEDDRVCVRAGFVGDTRKDEAEMAEALEAWVAALPGGEAEVIEIDGHPGLFACDPGDDVDLELTDRAEEALVLPNLWGYLVADAATVVSPERARCYARQVIDELTYEQISDPEGAVFQDDSFERLLFDSFQACA